MVLFHILKDLQKKYNFKLISAHVNHMFRGEQADMEEKYLLDMGKSTGEVVETLKVDVQKIADERKISSQDAGHQVRKEFFSKLAKKYAAQFIVLGHHQDDRVESFFLHLLHGAGSQGLTALPKYGSYGDGLKVFRPLMDYTKDEILEYCNKNQIHYFKDPSNEKTVYKRNKIRLELIPHLEKEYNPKIKEVLLRSIDILEDENAYLDEVVAEKFQTLVEKNSADEDENEELKFILNKKEFQKLHKGIKRRLIVKIFDEINKGTEAGLNKIACNFEKIEKVIQLLVEEKGQRSYKLSQEYAMEVNYQKGIFKKVLSEDQNQTEIQVDVDLIQIAQGSPLTIQVSGHTFIFADAEEAEGTLLSEATFPQPSPCGKDAPKRSVPSAVIFPPTKTITIRTRKDGDIIKPLGGKTKKLKKFLIEKKIPQDQRDHLILLASGKEVIWIPNLVISENFTASPPKYGHNKNNLEHTGKKLLKVLYTGEREFEK